MTFGVELTVIQHDIETAFQRANDVRAMLRAIRTDGGPPRAPTDRRQTRTEVPLNAIPLPDELAERARMWDLPHV